MAKLKAGFIGFMPFSAMGDPDAFYTLLEKYAAIGYSGFENATSLLRGNMEENLARVQAFGMNPIDIGEGLRGFREPPSPPEEVAEVAHKLGVSRITLFNNLSSLYRFGGRPEPASYDEVMKEIEEFEARATIYKREGIDLMYHNHDSEFTIKYRGIAHYDLIAANTENLTFELDCGWATYGGYDPIKLIHNLGKRVSALHLKDYQPVSMYYKMGDKELTNIDPVPRFTAVGSGQIDLYGCLKAGEEEGIEWAIVEQDSMNTLDQAQSLTCAYYNMKETGFVE